MEAMKSLKNKHAFFENEISEMRIVMESTREGLKKEQAKNDMKDSRIEVGIYQVILTICINSKIIDSQHRPEIFFCFLNYTYRFLSSLFVASF